jgi:hypothetical protein
MIHIDNVPADKLREQLKLYLPNEVIAVVVTRYIDGWAAFYQVIYEK